MIQARLIRKAMSSPCVYKVAAASLDSEGRLLHTATNLPGNDSCPGLHAEAHVLIKTGVRRVREIVIARVGRTGNLLPIHPCGSCKKLLDKYGIKISTIGGEQL